MIEVDTDEIVKILSIEANQVTKEFRRNTTYYMGR